MTAAPHTSNWDFPITIFIAMALGVKVFWMGKNSLFRKPFGSVMTKIRNRKIDPSYEIYLGLYQALTGPDEEDKIFKSVKRDFFDLIVIDECHRGSARDDHHAGSWRRRIVIEITSR